jgi:hypothetical protein
MDTVNYIRTKMLKYLNNFIIYNMDKNHILDLVKEWFRIDEDITKLNSTIKEMKTKKKGISEVLIQNMKEYDVKQFDTKKGKIQFTETKVKNSITKKYLNDCLTALIENDNDREKIFEYIYDKREVKIVDSIKRK